MNRIRTRQLWVLLCLLTLLVACGKDGQAQQPKMLAVTIADRTFQLELALDDDARYQGLSDRTSIADDGGMLFVMSEPRVLNFVMRRCLVPIDIIFLDAAGRVVTMHQMHVEPDPYAPEWKLRDYSSMWPAQFAIELKGGTIPLLNLQPGQKIAIPVDDLKRWAE